MSTVQNPKCHSIIYTSGSRTQSSTNHQRIRIYQPDPHIFDDYTDTIKIDNPHINVWIHIISIKIRFKWPWHTSPDPNPCCKTTADQIQDQDSQLCDTCMDLSSSMSSSPQIIPNRHFDVGAMLNQWLKRPPFRLRRSTRTQAARKPIVIYGETSSAEHTKPSSSHPRVFLPISSFHHWLHEEGMERVSPVQLAFLRPLMAWLCWCKGPRPRTTTPQKFRCQLQCQGLLVSQWHSLPKGTGTFPAAYLGASSLCVRCVAMLPLPSKLQDDTTSSHEID